MAGASDGEILPDVDYRILERGKELIDENIKRIIEEVAASCLETLNRLISDEGIRRVGDNPLNLEIPSDNLIADMIEDGRVEHTKEKEEEKGSAHTYRIAEGYRKVVEYLLKNLEKEEV